jgi:hypothetical protein
MLLNFAEEMDLKPVNPDDLPQRTEPAEELRRVKRMRLAKCTVDAGRCGRIGYTALPAA